MKYPFSVYLVENRGHVFWVAQSNELNSCCGQGDTAQEAVEELDHNEEFWLETAEEMGINIPEIKYTHF